MLFICTCAEWFSKILTEWNEDVEFLRNTKDLSHDSFKELHWWFPDYVKIEFEPRRVQIQQKNPQQFNDNANRQNPRKEEKQRTVHSSREKFQKQMTSPNSPDIKRNHNWTLLIFRALVFGLHSHHCRIFWRFLRQFDDFEI